MERAKSIEEYLDIHAKWKQELLILKGILDSTELESNIKWGAPVYSIGKKNVVGLGAFKAYVGLWFYQGVYLKDEAQVLINAQEEKTQAMRQWRFNGEEEMDAALIKQYIEEAIQNQKEGKELKPQKRPLIIPEELKEVLAQDTSLADAFDFLNLTKKREFCDYISEAKREATKQQRIEKIKPLILKGIGVYDKYK